MNKPIRDAQPFLEAKPPNGKKSFRDAVSATEPDWSREIPRKFWDPGRKLLRALRRYQAVRDHSGPIAIAKRAYWSKVHKFWSIVTQCEIHLSTEIEGGLLLPHPTGIIIHPDSKIGPNCLLFHQVTLASPVILGGHVDVGAGANLMGPLTVGNHVRVGANAVVTHDVPDDHIAMGVPARFVPNP